MTGASGFIGSALVRHFRAKGSKVVALARCAPGGAEQNVVWRQADLSRLDLAEDLFNGVDVFIHAAYAKQGPGVDAFHTNVEGARRLLEAANHSGVRQRIFFSSLSARSGALSEYGKQKYAIERLFNGGQDAGVRPGLVLGNGGLFAAMRDHVRRRRTVWLIGGGRQPLQTVYIDDLVAAVDRIVEGNRNGSFTVAEPEPVLYETFCRALCETLDVEARFFRVPYFAASLGIVIANRLGKQLPVNRDNLLGLKTMTAQDSRGSIEKLEINVRTWKESLRALKHA